MAADKSIDIQGILNQIKQTRAAAAAAAKQADAQVSSNQGKSQAIMAAQKYMTRAKNLDSVLGDYSEQINELTQQLSSNPNQPNLVAELKTLVNEYNATAQRQSSQYKTASDVAGGAVQVDKSGNAVTTPTPTSTTTPPPAPTGKETGKVIGTVPAQTTATAADQAASLNYPTATGGTGGKVDKKAQADAAAKAKADAAAKQKAADIASGNTGTTTGQEFLAKYGVQAALVNSDSSLQNLFKTAMAQGWDSKRFQAEFLNTDWAKNHSATWQNAETARLSAPGDYANSYNRMREFLARTAVSMGETITPDQLGTELKQNPDGSWPTVSTNNNDMVQWALSQSWGKGIDADAIKQHIAEQGKINLALPGGEAANTMSQLKSIANDYGLNSLNVPGSNYFSDAAQSVLLGKSTIDTWKQDMINTAKTNYKPYAAQLDAGVSLRSIASPYINALSNLLEVSPDTIDLSSSTGYGKMVSNALMGSDPTNPTPMTLNQFETQVKQDPRWATTTNARDTVMGGVGGLLKLLGKVGA